MIGAVVVAAGAGRRLGTVAKATLDIDGQSFLAAIAAAGRAAGVGEWVVVAGAPHLEVTRREAEALGLEVVVNPAPERGMASSVACGFAAAIASFTGAAALSWPVDHPRVAADTLRRLAEHVSPRRIVVPRCEGRGGHPPLVGREMWPELAACADAAEGARSVMRADPSRVVFVEVDDAGVLLDVDTPDALP